MNKKTGKSLKTFYLRKLETAAMFFLVPKQTASRLVFSIRFDESGRSFGIETCAMPPCGHHTQLLLCPCPCSSKRFLHAKAHTPLYDT